MLQFMETPDKFIELLKEKDSNEIVGGTRSASECPIARFIRSYTKLDYAVTETYYRKVKSLGMHKLQDWASLFIHRIDQEDKYITAQECLDIMEIIINTLKN
ncbi:MAG: hypothetical protein AABY07_10275 [Nanoarchaeota archaeon]